VIRNGVTLRVSVTADGELYVNGAEYPMDADAVARIKQIAATSSKPKAIIAGDRKTAYGGVMRAIDRSRPASPRSRSRTSGHRPAISRPRHAARRGTTD